MTWATFAQLEDNWKKVFKMQVPLSLAALQRTPDTDSYLEKIEDAEDLVSKIRTQLERLSSLLEQFEVPDSVVTAAMNASPTSNSSTTGNFEVPKFDLPKFKCNYKDWTLFYEQFISKQLPLVKLYN